MHHSPRTRTRHATRCGPAVPPGARSALAGLVIVAVLLPAGATAQNAPPNPLISATCGWPSHETAPEPPVLAQIERRLAETTDGYVAETANDGLAELKRWIRECDESASRRSVQELRRALDRNGSNPAVVAALGVALARGVDIQPPGATGRNFRPVYIQSNAEREVRRLLPRALEQWPDAALGDELAAMALATRDESSLKVAADALKKLSGELPSEATVWTARAEVAIARHEYGEAVEAAGKAAELGAASGFHALGVARLLRDEDPDEGARVYLQGLTSADAAAFYRYHEDIAPLLSLDEEREWAALADTARATWLRDKWDWRASTSGRTTADRLAVHFARMATAMERYQRMAHRGARPAEAIVWDSLQIRLPYDDRGLIYIRHGEPDDIERAPSGRMGPGKEAWLYFGLANGRAVFEFNKLRDWSDWIVTAPGGCDPFIYMYGVGGVSGEAKYIANEPPNTAWFEEFQRGVLDWGMKLAAADPSIGVEAARCMGLVVQARRSNPLLGAPQGQDPVRSRRSGRGQVAPDPIPDPLLEELPYIHLADASRRREAREEVDEALATETAVPRFEHFIQALSSIYTFRGDAEHSTVAAFLLLPAGQLTPRPLERGVAYPLKLSLSIEDNAEQTVQRLDTLIAFGAPQALPASAQMRTALQMPATPVLNATVRITVTNADHPDEGQILVGTKPIPLYPPDALTMSDLVVGQPGPGTWRRGAVSISPLPGHQIAAGGSFRLFYELYGAKEGETLRTRITIAPGTDPDLLSRLKALFGEQRVVELSFTETAMPGPDGTLQVERTITPSLDPGRYALEVTIDRPDGGGSVTMRTNILFLESNAGG